MADRADPSPVNIPNAITVGRIFLVPVLVVVLASGSEPSLPGAIIFSVAALSDAVDGYIARSRRLVTTLGKLLDPVADKLLVGAALVCLVLDGRLEAWVAAVILGREALVSALRAVAAQGGEVIAASALGKAKMALQVAMVVALLLAPEASAAWVQALVATAVAATVASGADYALAFRRRLSAARAAAA